MSAAASSISDTPVEILERILDFLHDDRAALFSASLVSRQWVHAPRHHLFSQWFIVEIYGRGHLMQDNANSFLALAQSDHCTILAAMKSVILAIKTAELINRVVNVLARSKTVSKVSYLHFSPSDLNHSIPWSGSALSNVRDFSCEFFYYTLNDAAWRLITSFHNLQTLSIYTDIEAIILPPDISISHFRNLRTLRLRLDPSKLLFEWLKSLDGTLLALETFDLRMSSTCHGGWSSVDALKSILEGFSNTLEHLSLGMDYGDFIKNESLDNGPCIDLSSLVNLRSLFMRTHDLDAICNSLESLSASTPLKVLTVHVLRWRYDCPCVLSGLITRLAGTLERRQFMGTHVLNLDVPQTIDLDIVRNELRKWKDKRALRLSHVDNHEAQCDTFETLRRIYPI